jgi:5-oxoprolinase (ATP-hydrolysing) subunit A
MRTIDINSDLGESFGNWRMGNDEALIPEITSANVACGFHASDPVTMIGTVALCKQHGVEVGSHPGLPDLLGFGRRPMRITPDDCYAYVLYQTGALQAVLAADGMTLHHVKPHGAFYSILREDEPLAAAFCEAALALMPEPVVYWPEGRDLALPREARARGIRVVMEVYVDMDYDPDGAIVIQREKHATDIGKASAQIRRFLEQGVVQATDGSLIALEAESICVHGDGPNALEVIQALRRTISDCGHSVAPLAAAASAR